MVSRPKSPKVLSYVDKIALCEEYFKHEEKISELRDRLHDRLTCYYNFTITWCGKVLNESPSKHEVEIHSSAEIMKKALETRLAFIEKKVGGEFLESRREIKAIKEKADSLETRLAKLEAEPAKKPSWFSAIKRTLDAGVETERQMNKMRAVGGNVHFSNPVFWR